VRHSQRVKSGVVSIGKAKLPARPPSTFEFIICFRYLEINKVILIGHSMGSRVVMEYFLFNFTRPAWITCVDMFASSENPFEPRIMHLGRRIDKVFPYTYA